MFPSLTKSSSSCLIMDEGGFCLIVIMRVKKMSRKGSFNHVMTSSRTDNVVAVVTILAPPYDSNVSFNLNLNW